MAESIGASSPISNDDGVLAFTPENAPSFNKALKKPTVAIDEEFINKHKEKALAGKSIVELADQIGGSPNGEHLYNEDLDSSIAARAKAKRVLSEAIQMLSEGDIDYWCPDAETKQSAPKIKKILEMFSARL